MNNVALVGNVSREPEVRQTPSQTNIAKFSIAVDDGFGDNKKTYFFDVIIFGKRTKVCQYLHKGSKVAISGKLQQNRWTDQDGKQMSRVEVVANDITLCGGSGGSQQQQGANYYHSPQPNEGAFYQPPTQSGQATGPMPSNPSSIWE